MLGTERGRLLGAASGLERAAALDLQVDAALVAAGQRVGVGVLLGGGVLGLLLGADPAGGPRALVEHAEALHLDQA